MALKLLRSRLLAPTLSSSSASFSRYLSRSFSTLQDDAASEVETDAEELKEIKESTNNRVPSSAARFQGVYKAVMVGEVGYGPHERVLSDGRMIVILSVGTSGLITAKARNEELQWHKVGVYPDRLREVAKKVKRGMRVYLEGNLETRLFNDSVTGVLKRQREISVRHDGQLILLDDKTDRKATRATAA